MHPPSSHHRAMEVFDRVCDLPTEEQATMLGRLCGDDAEMRRVVAAMLRHDAAPIEALRDPARGVVDALVADFAAEAGLPPPGGEPQPAQLGPYRVLRKLGEGGMGVVYLAEQQRPQRVVAIKVIRGAAVSAETLRRFEREAHVLGLLAHPGIAQIFEAGAAMPTMADGSRGAVAQPYLAMEFFDGAPITRFADERKLDARRRLALVAQACHAVEYAHQKGVIHRDLKPSNILVTEQGTGHSSGHATGQPASRAAAPVAATGATVKILDFGVARLIDPDAAPVTRQTDVGQIVGTLQYMSPEQVSADPAALDVRSDIYTLGVIMYELLSGRTPHDLGGQPIHEAARIIRDESPTRLSAVDRAFRGDIETIVGKALEKEPQRRYQGAAELAADIQRFLDDEPIVARPATVIEHVRKFVRRNRALSAVLAALAIALVGGSVASSLLALRAIAARNDAVTAQSLAEENARAADREADRARRKAYLANIAVADGALSTHEMVEAQRWLDAVAPPERGNWEWRYLKAQLDKAVATLLGPGSARYCVDESPDGALLVSAAWDGNVRLWDRARREVVATLEGHERPVYSVQFSPDGREILSASTDRTVRVWDVATRGERFVCRGHEAIVPCARYSPDGALIASCSEDGTVRLWRAATGEPLPGLTKHVPRQQLRWVDFSPDGERLAVACSGGATLIYDVHGADPVATLRGHDQTVNSVQFNTDGRRLVSASQDGTVHIWNARDWSQETVIDARTGPVRHATFSPDGERVAAAMADMTVRLYAARDGRALGVLTGHIGPATHASWSGDGTRLASTSSDMAGSIRLWDPGFASDMQLLVGHDAGVFALAYSPEGDIITSLGTDRVVHRWDAASGLPLATAAALRPVGGRDRSAAIRLSVDGRWLISATHSGSVVRTEISTGLTTDPKPIPDAGTITALFIGQDGRSFAAADAGGQIFVASFDDEAPARRFLAGADVRAVAINDDGTRLAAGDQRSRLTMWSMPDGAPIDTTQVLAEDAAGEGDRPIIGLRFSADGSLLIAAGYNDHARVWNGRTGAPLRALAGHPGGVRSVAISPDGRRFATGSATGSVRLWDASTGDEVMTFRVGSLPVLTLAFSRDGDTLAIGSADGLIRLCRTEPAAKVVEARDELLRLSRDMRPPDGVPGWSAASLEALLAAPGRSAIERRAAMHRMWRELHGE